MKSLLRSSLFIVFFLVFVGATDPSQAIFSACDQPKGDHSIEEKDGFVPGLYIVTSNLPGATYNLDGTLNHRSIVCAHQDTRTSGGSVIIPWAQFDKRNLQGQGSFDWTFVEEQMKPWVDRGQKVNLLVWPAVQQEKQLFPAGQSATPSYIFGLPNITFLCPDGSPQSGVLGEFSGAIPVPRMWVSDVWVRYAQALKAFVRRYENHPNVNYFRFGIGVGAESYPANGATTPTNYCMNTFINLFDGNNLTEKADNAYNTWKKYVAHRVQAFRRFNSKKPIVVTVNDFYTRSGQDMNGFPNMIADLATNSYSNYPKLGLGVQGATTRDIELYNSNQRTYANWGALFEQYKNLGVPLQLQTPLNSGVNGRPGPTHPMPECRLTDTSGKYLNNGRYGCTNTGNLAELIPFARNRGVRSFELYPYEYFVCNDKSFSITAPELNWHEQYGVQYNNAVNDACNLHQVS